MVCKFSLPLWEEDYMFEVQYVGVDMLSLNEWLGYNSHTFLMLVLCHNYANNTWISLKTHLHAHTHAQKELPVPSSLSSIRREMFSLSVSNCVRFPISSHLFQVIPPLPENCLFFCPPTFQVICMRRLLSKGIACQCETIRAAQTTQLFENISQLFLN